MAAGSFLLLLGGLVEGRPARQVGLGASVLGVGMLAVHQSGHWTLLGLAIGAYALVGIGLALGSGGSMLPVLGALAVAGFAAVALAAGTLVTSSGVVHACIPVTCDGVAESACFARVDDVRTRVTHLRPDLRVVSASATSEGGVKVCTATSGPFDPSLPEEGDGVRTATEPVLATQSHTCWLPVGTWRAKHP
ncbi:MAG: hypothetical protein U0869_23850 [Chloroflexota bacterium]